MSAPVIGVADLLAAEPTVHTVLVNVSAEPSAEAAEGQTPAGAAFLSRDDLAGPEGLQTGRLPLPDHAAFVARLETFGITPGSVVLVRPHGPDELSLAARAWVTLRWAGAHRTRVLIDEPGDASTSHSGALSEWLARAAALPPIRTGATRFALDPRVVVDYEGVAQRLPTTLLLDARGADAFASGHIPGAINFPVSGVLGGPLYGDTESIRAAFRGATGHDPEERPLILSCGSGISASLQALVLAAAGVEAPVYIGSWSEWTRRTESVRTAVERNLLYDRG